MPVRLATVAASARLIALNAQGLAPDWIHLLPASPITTHDGRGPYRVEDAAALIAASLEDGDRLPVDEMHATDKDAAAAPARGWIVQLESRGDGIWARVEWTKQGAELLADKAYRSISPVFLVASTGGSVVTRILRASLVNTPNLRGLATLHSEGEHMPKKLREALGLAEDATEETVLAAVTALQAKAKATDTQLQAQLAPIAKAAGIAEGAKPEAVLAAVQSLATKGSAAAPEVKELQAELTKVTTQLNALQTDGAKSKAEAYVDGAIKEGRVGVKPLRDHYVTRHMADAAAVEKEIASFPKLGASGALVEPPKDKDGEISLNAEQKAVAKMLGIPEDKMKDTLKTEREKEEAR